MSSAERVHTSDESIADMLQADAEIRLTIRPASPIIGRRNKSRALVRRCTRRENALVTYDIEVRQH